MKLKDWFEAIDYRITEGGGYGWNCYPNAHRLGAEFILDDGNNCSDVLFSTDDHTVYEITVSDNVNNRFYRWFNPDYREAYFEESRRRGFNPNTVFDNEVYIDLEVEADILEKLRAITEGRPYDERVQIELNFDDETLDFLFRTAHERDITLNQLIENILREQIDRHSPVSINSGHDDWEFA